MRFENEWTICKNLHIFSDARLVICLYNKATLWLKKNAFFISHCDELESEMHKYINFWLDHGSNESGIWSEWINKQF